LAESFSVNYLAGGRLNSPWFPTKTEPYIEGLILPINNSVLETPKILTLDFDTEMLSMSIAAERYEIFDYWKLFINNKIVMKNIYMKKIPEGVFLMVAKSIPANTPILLVFYNQSQVANHVWVNYQFLRDPEEDIIEDEQ